MENTFTQYAEYMKTLQDKSANTQRSYASAIENFLGYFAVSCIEDLQKLTASDVRKFRDELSAGGLKEASVNTYMRPIGVFFSWLVDNDFIETSVVTKVKALKEPHTMPNYLTEEEQKSLVAATAEGTQERLMILFLLYTGVRRAELVSIKISDIQEGAVKVYGKGRKERVVPLPEFLLPIINKYVAKRQRINKSEYLFTSKRRGETLTPEAVRVRVKNICERAGIAEDRDITPHILRHSYATNLVTAGVPLNVISNLLGHASTLVTEKRYAGVNNEVKSGAVAKLPVYQ